MKSFKLNLFTLSCLSLFIIVFFYIIFRALNICFTCDESLSYTLLRGEKNWVYDAANNHLLNTLFGFITSRLFGFSEISLRLFNVLSFIIFAFFSYKLVFQNLKNNYLSLLCFCFIILNQFVLDFFGLFRGYGLAVAFFSASLYYFLEIINNYTRKQLILGCIFSALTIYANFSFLTPILSLHFVFVLYFFKPIIQKFSLAIEIILILLIELLILAYALIKLIKLKETGGIYIGGNEGFFSDTFQSVLQYTFLDGFLSYQIIKWLFVFVFCCGLFFFKNKKMAAISLIIFFSVFIPILLNKLLDINFSTERATIYWTVLFGLFFAILLNILINNFNKKITILPFITILFLMVFSIFTFTKQANISYSISWRYDSNTKEALEDLNAIRKKENIKSINLGVTNILEPTTNYYREVKKYDWLNKTVYEDKIGINYDFYFIFNNHKTMLSNPYIILKEYHLSGGNLLLKSENKKP
jgi:hypothetical protein